MHHHHSRILDVALALAFTPACGTDMVASSDLIRAAGTTAQALEEDETGIDAAVIAKIQRSYAELKAQGSLNENSWHLGAQPPQEQTYARIPLDRDTRITDGYAKWAMVPVQDDGSPPNSFYLRRAGGVQGWQFLAGPYQIESKKLVLSEKDAGATHNIQKNDSVQVNLPSNPTTGYSWILVSTGLGQVAQEWTADRPGSSSGWGTSQFAWDTHASNVQSGETYPLHFVYKRPGDSRPTRDLVISVSVE